MKNFLKYTLAASAILLAATSCSDFGDVNENPESLNEGNVPLKSVFSNAQHQLLGSDWDGWRNQCIYAEQWMQHTCSADWWWSYGYGYSFSDGYSAAFWDGIYSGDRGAVRDVTTALDKWKDDPAHVADYQLARITRVLCMSRLTDSYGDLPYFEAGRPALYNYPKYDKQEDVYLDMLKELDEAYKALPQSGIAEMQKADIYYEGDVAKWRKFANSLMLRLAMRLTNVAPETAKKYAKLASERELIKEWNDNCVLNHPEGNVNNDSAEPVAKIYAQSDPGAGFLSRTFVETLQNGDGPADPRLGMVGSFIATGSVTAGINDANNYQYGSMRAADQVGLPLSGSWNRTSNWFVGRYPEMAALCGDAKMDDKAPENAALEDFRANRKNHYSTIGRYSYSDPCAPTFICTAVQTRLALAEAILRGWASGDAAAEYAEAIRQGVYQFQQFPKADKFYATALADNDLEAYVADKVAKFNAKSDEGKYSMIGTQYWIASFADSYETFANWRRTGYPELITMYDYQSTLDGHEIEIGQYSTEGAIPRRFTYSMDEGNVNEANYNEAVARLLETVDPARKSSKVGNSFYTRVWWDSRTLKANEKAPTTPWNGVIPFHGFE